MCKLYVNVSIIIEKDLKILWQQIVQMSSAAETSTIVYMWESINVLRALYFFYGITRVMLNQMIYFHFSCSFKLNLNDYYDKQSNDNIISRKQHIGSSDGSFAVTPFFKKTYPCQEFIWVKRCIRIIECLRIWTNSL